MEWKSSFGIILQNDKIRNVILSYKMEFHSFIKSEMQA